MEQKPTHGHRNTQQSLRCLQNRDMAVSISLSTYPKDLISQWMHVKCKLPSTSIPADSCRHSLSSVILQKGKGRAILNQDMPTHTLIPTLYLHPLQSHLCSMIQQLKCSFLSLTQSHYFSSLLLVLPGWVFNSASEENHLSWSAAATVSLLPELFQVTSILSHMCHKTEGKLS